jgi:diaminohydroxyphosphoribosylaminopyrimidine deaminase/5-amino-6-(5-phosphoribosylamino)uracil reductase
MVGAVIVDARGELAGEGYHAAYGGPHAEIVALADAGERARSGTLYVTLEPCAHHGKTQPCVDAILAAGLRRVVVALAEPTSQAGGGSDRLRVEGVEVQEGLGAERSRSLNRRWLHWVRFHRPWVTVKAAVSLDGRVATREGDSRWITGEEARKRGLELREEHDAILVGVETILADDPRLTRRLGLNPVSNWRRIVLDSKLRTPSEAVVVQIQPESTLIYHTVEAAAEDRRRLREAGLELVELRAGDDGRVDLEAVLDHLARREVAALLVEGGPTVHGSFNDAELVDEVALFIAPFVIGGGTSNGTARTSKSGPCGPRRLMFTGLIETVGTVDALKRSGGGARLAVSAQWPDSVSVQPGDSVAVNGACLTAVEPSATGFAADLSPETVQRTLLGKLATGDAVNLERALKLGDRIGGHIVQGHVDTTVSLLAVRPEGGFQTWRLSLPAEQANEVALKGSVALDGVSLTIAGLGVDWFEVALIPVTLEATTFGRLRSGASLHLETDVLAKYVAQRLDGRGPSALEEMFGGGNA